MALTKEEAQAHAKRLIEGKGVEFLDIYEDLELGRLRQADWELVYDQIHAAKVEVTF